MCKYTILCLIKIVCGTLMQKILRCVTLCCQFHKLKRQARCSKKQGKEGHINSIVLCMTTEPHVIIHARKPQTTVMWKRNSYSFCA